MLRSLARSRYAWSVLGLLGLATFAMAEPAKSAAKASPADLAFFETKIRPVLAKQCYSCHSKTAKKLGGKLLLDSREGLLAGGQSGPAIEPGQAEASTLIQALKYDGLEMPPEQPLPDSVIADFVKWVQMGAPYPAAKATGTTVAGKKETPELWSLKPVVRASAPAVKDGSWARNDIDRFVLARLEAAKLKPSPEADPRTLIRRLSYDLTGLPPTHEQVEAFAGAFSRDREAALEALVDSLLSSPHFGERWGRHWLDVARYAESNGNDGLSRNATFPHAWRYRDYVIQSFNDDVPYDRFLTEQIAGDLLPAATPAERDRLWIATGFLALGSKPAKAMNSNFDMDIVADQIEAVGSGIMGLSVACARCHDHKHDPIPTRDYYALAGIFASTESLYGLAANEGLTAPATELYQLQATKPLPKPTETPKRGKAPAKSKYPPGAALAMGARDRAKPVDGKINIQGESNKRGAVVPRGFLSACGNAEIASRIDAKQSGRLQLAEWLTDPTHPLTARVMANRIWHHLHGRGLVATCDDFGTAGEKPSHPELLDFLASELVARKWSVKAMIRSIVLSRTYRQASTPNPAAFAIDPDNTLLWRHSRRRLEAEALRDSILAASGGLELAPAQGSDIAGKDVLVNKSGNLHRPSRHRSVYLCMLRNSDPPDLAAFDLPDALKPLGARNITTLPTQSLFLMNSSLAVDESTRLAEFILANDASEPDVENGIRTAYRRALARDPAAAEIPRARAYLESIDATLAATEPDPSKRRARVWASFVQALFSASEFRYID